MFSAVGLFLSLKSKISYEQNVIYFQFYIRLPNFRLLGSIIFKKSPIWSIPLSILYRLFFETQGRKYGRNLRWPWFHAAPGCCKGFQQCLITPKSPDSRNPCYPTLLEALATHCDSMEQCSMGTLSLVLRNKVASSGPTLIELLQCEVGQSAIY